jgi:hypothetical protein
MSETAAALRRLGFGERAAELGAILDEVDDAPWHSSPETTRICETVT